MTKLLVIASEGAPFITTGGLGEVIGSLPKALCDQGVSVAVLLPNYVQIPAKFKEKMELIKEFRANVGWREQYVGLKRLVIDSVTYYFLDNEQYFARNSVYGDFDDGERFVYFCRAALASLPYLDEFPDVIHCHDWQTAAIPILLNAHYGDLDDYSKLRTVFTIHNLKYQGIYPMMVATDLMSLPDSCLESEGLEFHGKINLMKAGIVFCDALTTVSPSYAQEIKTHYYGENLDGLISKYDHKLTGILNGIEPLKDASLQKKESKEILRAQLGLAITSDAPIISMVSRLTSQKGIDLLLRVIDEILTLEVQMVILGSGEAQYEWMLREVCWRNRSKLRLNTAYNQELADLIYKASDIYLMPSLFEPCGIGQMLAMRRGAAPVVRETGGLKDTVIPYNQYTGEGNGFSFANINAHELLFTVQNAVRIYYEEPDVWETIVKRAMATDFDWKDSANQYKIIYERLKG